MIILVYINNTHDFRAIRVFRTMQDKNATDAVNFAIIVFHRTDCLELLLVATYFRRHTHSLFVCGCVYVCIFLINVGHSWTYCGTVNLRALATRGLLCVYAHKRQASRRSLVDRALSRLTTLRCTRPYRLYNNIIIYIQYT